MPLLPLLPIFHSSSSSKSPKVSRVTRSSTSPSLEIVSPLICQPLGKSADFQPRQAEPLSSSSGRQECIVAESCADAPVTSNTAASTSNFFTAPHPATFRVRLGGRIGRGQAVGT